MVNDRHPVARQLDVEFNPVSARSEGVKEGVQRVFAGSRGIPAVCNHLSHSSLRQLGAELGSADGAGPAAIVRQCNIACNRSPICGPMPEVPVP